MQVHHIAITVNNLEESIAFYTLNLGFRIVKKFSKERDGVVAQAVMLELKNVQIELWEFPDWKENKDDLRDMKIRGLRHIAFGVDDLEETISKLKKKGLEFSEPQFGASGHNYAFTTDPSGVALEFYENKEVKNLYKE